MSLLRRRFLNNSEIKLPKVQIVYGKTMLTNGYLSTGDSSYLYFVAKVPLKNYLVLKYFGTSQSYTPGRPAMFIGYRAFNETRITSYKQISLSTYQDNSNYYYYNDGTPHYIYINGYGLYDVNGEAPKFFINDVELEVEEVSSLD